MSYEEDRPIPSYPKDHNAETDWGMADAPYPLPSPPPAVAVDTFTNAKPVARPSKFRVALTFAGRLLSLVTIVGVLVWGLTAPNAREGGMLASRTPTSSPVKVEPQPLTQNGANAAAGAMLVAWHDPDHLNFVAWDIHRLTGCTAMAVRYQGPTGSTDPGSIPDDINPTVVGRAHSDTERLTVWWGCERG